MPLAKAGILASGNGGGGGGGGTSAPSTATFVTQTPNADLPNEQALSLLSTGLMKVTTTTGVVSAVTDSAGLAGCLSDETGSGAAVFGTNPTLVGYTQTGVQVLTYTAMAANAIDMTKPGNTYTATSGATITYSNNTPTAGTRTMWKITCDSTNRTLTIPSTYSFNRAGNITSLALTASTTISVLLEYTGAAWQIYGDPVATAGTGAFLLANSCGSVGIVIDGGGSAITTGVKGDISVPYNCTIVSNRVLADQSGSIVIDIWKDTYANYPPTVADTITASAKPTLSSAAKSQDTTLTGWTTTITAGDTLRFNVDSASTVTRVVLQLTITRT